MRLLPKHHWNIATRRESLFDWTLARLVKLLKQLQGQKLAHSLLTLMRLRHWNSTVPHEKERPSNPAKPLGPFVVADKKRAGDILLYVPRHLYGQLLDDLSGGYGYSHLTVDCGEIDVSTGKRVMVEAMPNTLVHRSFLDEYGKKRYARVSLARTGIDREAFCNCVKSMIGDAYDYADVVTWGGVDDPAKQVCTDLAAGCLPEAVQRDFANKRLSGDLRKNAVSVYHPRNKRAKVFISPNGFAEYFGLPTGDKIRKPGQLFTPEVTLVPETARTKASVPWAVLLGGGLGFLIVFWVGQQIFKRLRLT